MSSNEKNRYPLVPISCAADCDFEANHLATYGSEAKLFTNVLIRSLNSIYYTAPRVRPGDEADFAGYCLCTLGAIDGHQQHSLENIFFPVLQKKNDMSPFVRQHAAYKDRVNKFDEYVKSVAAKGPYDGLKVRELLESFGDELVKTLHEEAYTVDPERLKEYDENETKEMFRTHRALLQKLLQETPMPVFAVTHHDLSTAPSWPPQAKDVGPVDKLKVYNDTKGYWKFAPYSIKHNGETQTYA